MIFSRPSASSDGPRWAALALLVAPVVAAAHVEADAPADSATEMEYRVALEINPRDVATRARLAHLLLARFRLGEAERELAAVLAAAPGHAGAAADTGVLLAMRGRPAEAIPWFQRALAARREDPATWLHLALALELLGRSGDALAACCTSLAQHKPGADSAEAHAALRRLGGTCPAPAAGAAP